MTLPIYLDLSEILATPVRTGIQRVEREAIRHWSGSADLIPCCATSDGELLRLDSATLDALCADDDGTPSSRDAERSALARFVAQGVIVRPGDVAKFLNLELFFNPVRADLHVRLATRGARVLWFVHDFLPFLQPEHFPSGTSRNCMHYLRALRGIGENLAFVSDQTRRCYVERVARKSVPRESWPVIHLGADGFGLERQTFRPDRQGYVSVGTIETRKNPLAMLEGFELLWKQGRDIRLTIAGRLSPDATTTMRFIEAYRNDPRLVVLEQPSDDTLRAVLRKSRALIMPSENEGFGLPPYEAVFAGIPAIASVRLPSVELIKRGALVLERVEPHAIAAAVTSLQDDVVAARLWADAATAVLPTWQKFGHDLAAWAEAA